LLYGLLSWANKRHGRAKKLNKMIKIHLRHVYSSFELGLPRLKLLRAKCH